MKGVKRFIKLKESEKRALEDGWKKGKKATFRNRCHYILLSDKGMTINEIGAIYNKGYQAISRWLNRYEKKGINGLHTAKGNGRHPIIRIDNETEMKTIEELVEKHPKNLKIVVAKIKEDLGKKMSVKTLQRVLKKKYIWKRFRKVTPKQPDATKYEEKKGILEALIVLFLGGPSAHRPRIPL